MIKENKVPDITISIKSKEYIVIDTIIDPITKDNVKTYILKDNQPISFNFANYEVVSKQAFVENYYYTQYNNKNIKLRSREFEYTPGTELMAVRDETFVPLKATGRLNDCLFKYTLSYDVLTNGTTKNGETTFYIMIVPASEYDAYKKTITVEEETVKSGEVKRPKKAK